MDLKFSPTQNILALAQITGHVRLYAYGEDRMDEVCTFNHHTDSCRTIDFNDSGSILYVGSSDKSFSVISNGRVEGKLDGAHDEPINSICHLENDHIVATGDDDGLIKIWDLRQAQHGTKKACAITFKEHEGSITGMTYVAGKNMLLSTACDGMLGVWDLKKPELYAMSDSFEEDLSAICIMKEGRKVLTASQEGIINIFKWDWFGDCNDRIVGHP